MHLESFSGPWEGYEFTYNLVSIQSERGKRNPRLALLYIFGVSCIARLHSSSGLEMNHFTFKKCMPKFNSVPGAEWLSKKKDSVP